MIHFGSLGVGDEGKRGCGSGSLGAWSLFSLLLLLVLDLSCSFRRVSFQLQEVSVEFWTGFVSFRASCCGESVDRLICKKRFVLAVLQTALSLLHIS